MAIVKCEYCCCINAVGAVCERCGAPLPFEKILRHYDDEKEWRVDGGNDFQRPGYANVGRKRERNPVVVNLRYDGNDVYSGTTGRKLMSFGGGKEE
jgi:hypothetical protein